MNTSSKLDEYSNQYFKTIEYTSELIDILIKTHYQSDKLKLSENDKKIYFRKIWKLSYCQENIKKLITKNNLLNEFRKYAVSIKDNIHVESIKYDQILITRIVKILNVMHTNKLNITKLMNFIQTRIDINESTKLENVMNELDNIKIPTTTPKTIQQTVISSPINKHY